MVAIGVSLSVILDHVIPEHGYNGILWFIFLMLFILIGVIFSVASLIWCIGCLIEARPHFPMHPSKHRDSQDAT